MLKLFVAIVCFFIISIQNSFSQEIDTLPATLAMKSFEQKINFSPPYSNDKKLSKLVLNTMQHTTAIGVANGTYQLQGGRKMDFTVDEIENEKKEFYEDIRKKYPELKLEEYSRENYYSFLLTIPNIAARLGLYTEVYFEPKEINGKFISEIYYSFSDICDFSKINIDGKEYEVTFLSNSMTLNGEKNQLPLIDNPSGGCSRYQTIFVEKEIAEKYVEAKKTAFDNNSYSQICSMGPIKLWEKLEGASRNEAAYISYQNLILCNKNRPITYQDLVDKITCHESSHIEFQHEKFNQFPIFTDFSKYTNFYENASMANETLAYLGELIKEKNIDQSISDLIFCWGEKPENLHMTTLQSLFDLIIAKVVTKPEKYDCTIDKKLDIKPEYQAAFQLAGMVNKPEKIKMIAFEIRDDIVRNNFKIPAVTKKNNFTYPMMIFFLLLLVIISIIFYYKKNSTQKNDERKRRKGGKKS